MLVCKQCGGTNVQTKVWADSNTNEFRDYVSECEGDDNWCEDCQSQTFLIELTDGQETVS